MKRLCFGSLVTVLYQARIGSKTVEDIVRSILQSFDPYYTSYDSSVPGHLKAGEQNTPTQVRRAAEEAEEEIVAENINESLIPLIKPEMIPALIAAIKAIITEDENLKSFTIIGYTDQYRYSNVIATDEFNPSQLMANLFYYVIRDNKNRLYKDSIAEIPDDFVESFMNTPAPVPIPHNMSRTIMGTPRQQISIMGCNLYIGNDVITLPEELAILDSDSTSNKYEKDVVDALIDRKKKNGNPNATSSDMTSKDEEYLKNQRRYFYHAERLRRGIRDVYEDGNDQFDYLKEQTYEGVIEKYSEEFHDGYCRLQAVLSKATDLPLNQSVLANAVSHETRKGMCHVLANEGIIKSWVKEDDEDESI